MPLCPNAPASQLGTGRTDAGSNTPVPAAETAIKLPDAIRPANPSHASRADSHRRSRDLDSDLVNSTAPPRDALPSCSLTAASEIIRAEP